MCGIVGGVAERNISTILLEGLKRLEYRGYDSSGMALLKVNGRKDETPNVEIIRYRALGKIASLQQKMQSGSQTERGRVGIAHTRWATHGVPSENNAHPHICNNQVAVVHNGIIENYQALKTLQIAAGYRFTSQTDTEVIAHCIYHHLQAIVPSLGQIKGVQATPVELLQAVQKTLSLLEGAYAIGVISPCTPDTLIAARKGSPLVIGVGFGEYFIASDVSALLPVTQRFIFLEEGDVALIQKDALQIFDVNGCLAERKEVLSQQSVSASGLNGHRHYMHKEIFEQPQAVVDTLEGRIANQEVLVDSFGASAAQVFERISQVQIIACGTSYHAGLVAKYWFEDILRLPCQVEVASEYRYRNPVIANNTLVVTISQSGETADTLAALKQIQALKDSRTELFIPTLTICNVPESSLIRASDLTFLTHAGPEIGVASTKAFTTQLVALALLLVAIGKTQKCLTAHREGLIVKGLIKLPGLISDCLAHEADIKLLAQSFADKHHAIFLGRGTMYPIAMEGALKLKEISYIHAEAYPAGELKHGPLALIDETMPVIAIAPHDELIEKLKSNLQEVSARGGQMIVFEDERSGVSSESNFNVIKATTNVGRITAPITFNIALQLLSYHVALIKGTDVDQPRNLAKSVTVE
ncbi:glutamine--fructose-6-phosphate aminotransferase [isomerizing] [Thiosulfatimonas sediminis]|uniref:Glutamine--fructose-6-phosphate aminotransferase [isomerizing] n=1 Tax=Thiosulfatimonas sediminis TaxID=2675054 RepID=A0A6F8PT08_9GAMM|nr:glutamine--fructose-6-phosphate transaminase (isomerizing) [Thiosulfatimonas sediminis]BBP45261.1 glutamine--fructose-6-phosphate aminotransferase [isomerizing] [Thiosulfatimonas sediminis]